MITSAPTIADAKPAQYTSRDPYAAVAYSTAQIATSEKLGGRPSAHLHQGADPRDAEGERGRQSAEGQRRAEQSCDEQPEHGVPLGAESVLHAERARRHDRLEGPGDEQEDERDRQVGDELVRLQAAEHRFTLREALCGGIRPEMYDGCRGIRPAID